MDAPVKALNTEKAKALQAALAQIEKQFGKGTIMRLGEGEVIDDIEVVSTGSLGLDIALGVGGLPRGRVIEISADSIYDEVERQAYYRVLVETETAFVQSRGRRYPIVPGMVTDVEIITGRKSILSYLLKPITRGMGVALTER